MSGFTTPTPATSRSATGCDPGMRPCSAVLTRQEFRYRHIVTIARVSERHGLLPVLRCSVVVNTERFRMNWEEAETDGTTGTVDLATNVCEVPWRMSEAEGWMAGGWVGRVPSSRAGAAVPHDSGYTASDGSKGEM